MGIPGEKLLIKMWESITDKGIGSLLKPWQIRREGRAVIDVRRDELLALAQAEEDAAAIRSGRKILSANGQLLDKSTENAVLLPSNTSEAILLPNLEQIADRNIHAEAIRREISISKAVLHAEEELSQDTQEPPEENLSDDWLLRWRDCAASVSSVELQSLWGKVLAGEVKCPGRFSLRTLEFLRNLAQDEAKAIEKLSPFVVGDLIFRGDKGLLESEGISFSLLLSIQELGIVSGVDATGLEKTWSSQFNNRFESALASYGRVLMVRHSDPAKKLRLPVYKVTALGSQILSLGTFQANERYLRVVGASIKAQGFDVEIGDYVPVRENQINVFNMQPL